jgi:hypothetical protein
MSKTIAEINEKFKKGKAGGVFRPEVNPRVFRNMFLGTFYHLTTRWLVHKKKSEVDMMKEANQMADLVTNAVLSRRSQDNLHLTFRGQLKKSDYA